jgi:flavoprotein
MQYDIWAITPATSATLLKAAASVAGAGAVTLLTNDVSAYGTGYKLLFTSAGNDSGITFTITGH